MVIDSERVDILDIWSYIADASENAADPVGQIYDACAFVAEAPMRGHSRPDLNLSLHYWTLGRTATIASEAL